MKQVICALTLFASVGLYAQNAASPALTATPLPTSPPGKPNPGTRSPANPAQPGAFSLTSQNPTNALAGAGLTNQFGTNFLTGNLGSALLVLQNNLQQVLPLIAAFNANSAAGIQQATGLAGQNAGAAVPANSAVNNGVNFGQNNGVNFAQNNGVNLATSVATPTVSPAATPPSVFAQPTNAPVPPTALAPAPTTDTNVVGTAVTPATANTLAGSGAVGGSPQLMVILQNDIQRLLSEISTITGVGFSAGGNATFATNTLGVAAGQLGTTENNANNTGTPRILTRPTTPRTLTPTGR